MAVQTRDGVPVVAHGSPEHEALVAAGYQMTAEEAKAIIKERETNPALHSHEDVRNAKAMLAAVKPSKAQLKPSSDKPGWKAPKHMGR